MKPTSMWSKIYNEADVDKAIDILFEYVDDLLLAGEFAEVDEFLQAARMSELSKTLIVATLSITLAAKDKLHSREGFYYQALNHLHTYFHPTEISSLLKGLK